MMWSREIQVGSRIASPVYSERQVMNVKVIREKFKSRMGPNRHTHEEFIRKHTLFEEKTIAIHRSSHFNSLLNISISPPIVLKKRRTLRCLPAAAHKAAILQQVGTRESVMAHPTHCSGSHARLARLQGQRFVRQQTLFVPLSLLLPLATSWGLHLHPLRRGPINGPTGMSMSIARGVKIWYMKERSVCDSQKSSHKHLRSHCTLASTQGQVASQGPGWSHGPGL